MRPGGAENGVTRMHGSRLACVNSSVDAHNTNAPRSQGALSYYPRTVILDVSGATGGEAASLSMPQGDSRSGVS
jgi:hypothetical protein